MIPFELIKEIIMAPNSKIPIDKNTWLIQSAGRMNRPEDRRAGTTLRLYAVQIKIGISTSHFIFL